MDDHRKDSSMPKRPMQRMCGRQLLTNNLLAFDVEADDGDPIKYFI